MNESHYMFTYWLMGTFFDDLETLTLSVGIVRSFESIGSCLAFGIGAAKVKPMVNLIISFVMFAITIPATSWAVYLVPERPTAVVELEVFRRIAAWSLIGVGIKDHRDVNRVVEATLDRGIYFDGKHSNLIFGRTRSVVAWISL